MPSNHPTISTAAIDLNGVSKKYRLYHSPLDRLKSALHLEKNKSHKEFEALRGMSFAVEKGSTLGIIGRNGSGKSTLLQIIAGVIRPTLGRVTTQGSIASLLELGAGFNPEFTGRENVFLSGMLAGFSKKEMSGKMAEIERFADIGEYFDQPVRTYSSGMFVRLAFSTVIHTNPDIFLIDEALAVGDARFQQKCYQKFKEFQKQGKTIVFVTHDMDAIVRHSDRALLLENGQIRSDGKPAYVVNVYHELLMLNTQTTKTAAAAPTDSAHPAQSFSLEQFLEDAPLSDRSPLRSGYNKNEFRYGTKKAQVVDFLTLCGNQFYPSSIRSGDTLAIYLKVLFNHPIQEPLIGFSVKTVDGIIVHAINSRLTDVSFEPAIKNQIRIFKFSLKMDLHFGDYMIDAGVADRLNNHDDLADSRAHFIHLRIAEDKRFEGLAYLESRFEEIRLPETSKKNA